MWAPVVACQHQSATIPQRNKEFHGLPPRFLYFFTTPRLAHARLQNNAAVMQNSVHAMLTQRTWNWDPPSPTAEAHRMNPATDQDKITPWIWKDLKLASSERGLGNLGELDGGGRGDDGVSEELGREREDAVLLRDLGFHQRREDAAEVHAQDLQVHRHHGRLLLPRGRRRWRRRRTGKPLLKWAAILRS
jgi:hypothetical protein